MKSPYFSMFCLHCTERRAHLDKTTILKNSFNRRGGVVFFGKIDTPGERGDLEGGHGKGHGRGLLIYTSIESEGTSDRTKDL